MNKNVNMSMKRTLYHIWNDFNKYTWKIEKKKKKFLSICGNNNNNAFIFRGWYIKQCNNLSNTRSSMTKPNLNYGKYV